MSKMERIEKGNERQLAPLLKCVRRVEVSSPDAFPKPNGEKEVEEALKEGRALLLVNGSRVLAFLTYSFDVGAYFFPEEKGRASKGFDLLDEAGVKEERAVLIERIGVDPMARGKGMGAILLRAFLAKMGRSSYLAPVPKENREALEFFYHHGFFAKGDEGSWEFEGKKPSLLMVKLLKREGLASLNF